MGRDDEAGVTGYMYERISRSISLQDDRYNVICIVTRNTSNEYDSKYSWCSLFFTVADASGVYHAET